ncbi:cyclodeaminase/cyclohydrolase family protein [uncultured Salinicola sp.]|uniref:cyclodeaminase/cyclohydrolase family protein n=1 Tax=uncultured Salinicola sp. TaxID=1193542 RepID=UPI00261D6FDA|nr:cyclodeaminase/cyclohydrolase family protein [uncultured Salinicola sp.]
MSTSSSLWQASLADFQHAVETRSTPGCGAAAALNGCLGLSLILKGVRLHRGESGPDPQRRRLIDEGDALQQALAEAVDDDAAAFDDYLQAQRRSSDDAAESDPCDSALREAREASIRIPLAAAERCRQGLALAVEALPLTSSAMRSDTLAGATMLGAALEALLIGAEANLEALPDHAARQTLEVRCEALRREVRELRRRLGTGG